MFDTCFALLGFGPDNQTPSLLYPSIAIKRKKRISASEIVDIIIELTKK